jgi:hypothetical protein
MAGNNINNSMVNAGFPLAYVGNLLGLYLPYSTPALAAWFEKTNSNF